MSEDVVLIDFFTAIANKFLTERGVACFDALVAQGMLPPRSDSRSGRMMAGRDLFKSNKSVF